LDATDPKIESADDHDDTRSGLQARWDIEISAAKKNQEEFWTQGDSVIKEFLGEADKGKRLNLFHADVVTKAAQLFGNQPKIRARRRFADASDEPGRVAGEAIERLLNTDVERSEDGFQTSLDNALSDWLKPGLGCVRFRYVVDTEMGEETPARVQSGPCPSCRGMLMPGEGESCPTCGGSGEVEQEIAPAVPAQETKTFEDVETDHVYWKDFLWSPCRTWSEVRWVAFRVEMSRDALHERYDLTAGEGDEKKGRHLVSAIPLKARETDKQDGSSAVKDVWSRAEVWEIWDKDEKEVVHFVEGFTGVLDVVEDPLGLPNFFPCPRPLMTNTTTTRLMPKAPYLIVEDLYQEAHQLTRRIAKLVEAIKVAGIYDRQNEGVQKLLEKSSENVLIPVDNWASFMEKGGIAGAMGFLPLEPTVAAVVQLIQQRNIIKRDLYEITGQSDIMRGQAAEKATATEQRIKARFGGTRIVADQKELARFASEGQRIRAHIIAKMFDPATIIQRSNMEKSPDAPFLPAAIELLKSNVAQYRIEVDAESLSMTDFDAQQQEGIAIMQATAEFFKNFAPLLTSPSVGVFILELYQQFITQFRGANRFETIIDRGIDQLKKAASAPPPPQAPPPPDPRMATEQVRAQTATIKAQADIQTSQMDVQGAAIDLESKKVDFGTKMAEMRAAKEDALMMSGGPVMPGEF
jgi:uncharacterized Zn finger protein (UPF0148 family)